MDSYKSFAKVYDLFMDNVPYKEWSKYVQKLLKQYHITDGIVLDLGCGTGSFTELLAAAGFDMIGIDNSEEMLDRATEKKAESGHDILYLLQDMREFELYGTVRAIISICDSINYILNYEELIDVFSLVNNYLDPDGVFIFDLNTKYKYQDMLGNTTIAENREKSSFIWDNYYYEDEAINEYELTLFIRQENNLYEKFVETHYQKVYSIEEIQSALKEAGLTFITAYDAFTSNPPHDKSERIYIIACKSNFCL